MTILFAPNKTLDCIKAYVAQW